MIVHELRVEIRPETVPAVEDLLAEREELRLMVLEDKVARRAWLAGYFPSSDEARGHWASLAGGMTLLGPVGEPVIRELVDRDWRESYRAHFRASSFGRLHWVPVWERASYQVPQEARVLWLDPGMAFGTGNHETTRLVAERLAEFAEGPGPRGRVIDAGCGSGILALSAARLGFSEVEGFDNDPEAIRVSEENAALNGLQGQVRFFLADLDSGLRSPPAALVLANIQADVLMRFADLLVAAVAPGGGLVLSGVLAREREDVEATFSRRTSGWSIDSRTLGEWCDLSLRRP